jgi:hypothetical protein
VNLAADLREAYDLLREKLRAGKLTGNESAALAREIRLLGEKLELLEAPEEVGVVDQLARKRAESGVDRPAGRRRKSG